MKGVVEEANMTVVAIILISLIVAIATPIVRNMMTNTQERTTCMNDGGCWVNGQCDPTCSAGTTGTTTP